MKKLIALLLVVMMLGSTVAFADTNASIAPYAPEDYKTDGSVLDTPKTELWLQVDATGQIDVTVPLVLVFKTDIDGGVATSPLTYKMTNNSSSDLVVTQIDTVVEQQVASTNPMAIVAYTTANRTDLARDQYQARLRVLNGVVLGSKADGTSIENSWDLATASHANDKVRGGLFELIKDADTRIIADMSTGELSFITPRAKDADGNDAGMDTTQGVKLLTVTYTVAIDTSDAIGTDITDDSDGTKTDTKDQSFTTT